MVLRHVKPGKKFYQTWQTQSVLTKTYHSLTFIYRENCFARLDITLHVQSRGTWTKRLYYHVLRLDSRAQQEKHRTARRFERLSVRLSTDEKSNSDVEAHGVTNTPSNPPNTPHVAFDLVSDQQMRVRNMFLLI